MKSLLLLAALGLLCSCYAETISAPVKFATNAHWYQIVTPNSPVTFQTANAGAGTHWLLDKQGYLVTINDANEATFLLNNYYNSPPSTVANPSTWTGGRRAISGSSSNYYWYALNRVSIAFSSSNACIPGQYCAWTTQPSSDLTLNCIQAFFPSGNWKSANCSGTDVSPFYIIEYDTPSTTCASGYKYSDAPYPQCNDINECLTAGKCSAGYTCTNTPGSYTCDDTNECLNPSACSPGYTCTNTVGSFTCTAPTCSPTCQNGGSCAAPNQCTCTNGWTGPTCGTPVCSTPCTGGATCTAPDVCSGSAPYVNIVNPASGYVLDIATNADGFTYVVINQASGADSQLWRVYNGYVQNKLTGKVVDVKDNQIEPLRPIIVWDQKPVEYAGNQLWTLPSPGTPGPFVVTSNSQFVLDIYQGIVQANQPVNLWWAKTADQGTDNQIWVIGTQTPSK